MTDTVKFFLGIIGVSGREHMSLVFFFHIRHVGLRLAYARLDTRLVGLGLASEGWSSVILEVLASVFLRRAGIVETQMPQRRPQL